MCREEEKIGYKNYSVGDGCGHGFETANCNRNCKPRNTAPLYIYSMNAIAANPAPIAPAPESFAAGAAAPVKVASAGVVVVEVEVEVEVGVGVGVVEVTSLMVMVVVRVEVMDSVSPAPPFATDARESGAKAAVARRRVLRSCILIIGLKIGYCRSRRCGLLVDYRLIV
ncbi:hypothetical protein BJY00DRAFT_140169 [Aspergillus carlsbadensis]|nr:hypothetical protein BJY00DRAFT_140169 [Aspergillus carlsbadensis]